MKQYYFVTRIENVRDHLDSLENKGKNPDSIYGAAIVRACSIEDAKSLFLTEEYNRHPVSLDCLYHMFLEDFCFYKEHHQFTKRDLEHFLCYSQLLKVREETYHVWQYQTGYTEEIENELKELVPFDSFLSLFPTTKERAAIYALINRYKTVAWTEEK